MTRKARPYRDSLLKRLVNPVEAEAYLKAGLDDSIPAFLKALRNVIQAHQMAKVAKDSGLQRETLYRSFSEQGNPTLGTLWSVLNAVGLKLTVEIESRSQPLVAFADVTASTYCFDWTPVTTAVGVKPSYFGYEELFGPLNVPTPAKKPTVGFLSQSFPLGIGSTDWKCGWNENLMMITTKSLLIPIETSKTPSITTYPTSKEFAKAV